MTPMRARILLVDDEPNVLATSREILVREGYDVDAVADGLLALAALERTAYDLVLTDLKMDGMDGLDLLLEVQKRSPQTVTVLMTGYGSVDSAIEAVRRGAYEYLLKPVAVEELKQAVVRSLERKRLSEIDTLYKVGNDLAIAQSNDAIHSVVIDAVERVLGAKTVLWLSVNPAGQLAMAPAHEYLIDASTISRLENQEVVLRSPEGQDLPASVIFVPGIAHGRLKGILYVDHGSEPFDYHASWQRFLCGLAAQAALALDRLALLDELRQNNSSLEAANRRLQELDLLKSQFLSVATHELRTPLSIILGYNTMIEESAEQRLTAEERGLLQDSLAACKRLMRLVNSMLDLSQIQSGKMRLQFSPVDLSESLHAVIKMFEAEAQRRGLRLELEIDGDLPQVEIDAERIEQVFINLLGNALKYTDADGMVTVHAGVNDRGKIEVRVTDTGIGIAEEHQSLIFDEFARVRSKPAVRPGSGLGLAIARRIVEAHGGQLSVTSIPGQGSTFVVQLPNRHRAHSALSA